MIAISSQTERLTVIRAASPLDQAEVDRFVNEAACRLRGHGNHIVCTDIRQLHVLTTGHAARLAQLMQSDNRYIFRSAFLVAPAAALVDLQFYRLLGEAESPARRMFRAPADLEQWLAPVLTREEGEALSRFLADDMTSIRGLSTGCADREFAGLRV